jgi:hypothetical protein
MPHRDWGFSTNNLYYTSHIYLEERSWFWHFVDCLSGYIHRIIPPIPFPSFIKFKHKEDGEVYNLKEYYGDLKHYYFAKVINPLISYIYQYKTKRVDLEVPYTLCEKYWHQELIDREIYLDPEDEETEASQKEHRKSMEPFWTEYDEAVKKIQTQSDINIKKY